MTASLILALLLFFLSLRISFILVELGASAPLTATQALAVLEQTDALERIRAEGFQATSFTRAVEPPQQNPSECMSVHKLDIIHVGIHTHIHVYEAIP